MTSSNTCRNHPEARAEYMCHTCLAPICEGCVRTTDAGTIVCPSCEAPAAAPAAPEALESVAAAPEATYEVAPAAERGWGAPPAQRAFPGFGKCANHPEADACAVCANCRAKICATCDFSFPGNVHLCPACATDPKQGLTPKRKGMAYTSMGLAAVNVVGSGAVLIVPHLIGGIRDQDTLQMLGCVIMVLLVSAAIGAALGFSAFRKHSQNPFYLWIGPILNSLIGVTWLGLIIVGNMR